MNLIVLCTDTLRADCLGCYGNDWMETPHLDAFAEKSIVYESCWGESLPTVQARRAWFTGHSLLPFSKEPQPKGVYCGLCSLVDRCGRATCWRPSSGSGCSRTRWLSSPAITAPSSWNTVISRSTRTCCITRLPGCR